MSREELLSQDTQTQRCTGFIESYLHTLRLPQDTQEPRYMQTPPPPSPHRHGSPLPMHEPLTKARAEFAESLARPLTPLHLLLWNESNMKQISGPPKPKHPL